MYTSYSVTLTCGHVITMFREPKRNGMYRCNVCKKKRGVKPGGIEHGHTTVL